jgi:hypothetical protein
MDHMARLLALAACAGVAFGAGAAQAAESKVTVVNAGAGTDAVKVVRDKDTGKIRAATSDEIAAMGTTSRLAPNVSILNRPATTMIQRPDGSATIRRSLEDLDSIVAERGADGRLSKRHGDKHAPAASSQTAPKE